MFVNGEQRRQYQRGRACIRHDAIQLHVPGSGSQSAPLNRGVYLARCSATVTSDYSVTASFPDQVTVTRPAIMNSTAGIAIAALQIQASDNLSGQTFTYAATGSRQGFKSTPPPGRSLAPRPLAGPPTSRSPPPTAPQPRPTPRRLPGLSARSAEGSG